MRKAFVFGAVFYALWFALDPSPVNKGLLLGFVSGWIVVELNGLKR